MSGFLSIGAGGAADGDWFRRQRIERDDSNGRSSALTTNGTALRHHDFGRQARWIILLGEILLWSRGRGRRPQEMQSALRMQRRNEHQHGYDQAHRQRCLASSIAPWKESPRSSGWMGGHVLVAH